MTLKSRLFTIARWGILIWGAFSLVGVLALVGFSVYQAGPGNRDRIDQATPQDVRFVLNGCGLGDDRIEKVLHSHVSSRSFTGDHLDAYAIKISSIELAELTKSMPPVHGRWFRGDQLPPTLDDAVGFMGGWLHQIPWFPREKQLRSSEYYVYLQSIYYHGMRPTAAKVILIRPSDSRVFYFGGKT